MNKRLYEFSTVFYFGIISLFILLIQNKHSSLHRTPIETGDDVRQL